MNRLCAHEKSRGGPRRSGPAAAQGGQAWTAGLLGVSQLEHPHAAALLQEVHAFGHVAAPQRHRAAPARDHGHKLLAILLPGDRGATTPEPVWNCHTTLPVLASAAFRKPSGVPQNTRLPAVVITPPHSGALFLTSHTILPLFGSTARRAPM